VLSGDVPSPDIPLPGDLKASPCEMGMSIVNGWVTRINGKRLFWMPVANRGSSQAFKDSKLVFGSGSGRVTILDATCLLQHTS